MEPGSLISKTILMSQERFYVLMRRYINDELDQQGMTELKDLLRTGHYEAELKAVFDEVYDAPRDQHDLSPDRARKILLAILASEDRENGEVKVLSFQNRFRKLWWAAAAVLILTGWLLVARQFMRSPAPVAIGTTRPSLPPHSDKAILTLANGQQVILDKSASRSIAAQNGVDVARIDSGRLSYSTKDASVAGGYNVLTTPRGGQFEVQLPDGTRAWLNSASRLRYPLVFNGAARNVELDGEAYFEVAKNSRQPFSVQAGGIQVKVLGTGFNLMAYADEDAVRTTLIEGSVRLEGRHTVQVIKPGQQGSLGKDDDHFVITRPDLDDVLAWKNGEFRFSGEKIQTIMRQLTRWYDVEVEYQGAPPANRFDGDILKGKDGSTLLDMLETTRTVHFRVEGRKIIVIGGPAEKSQ